MTFAKRRVIKFSDGSTLETPVLLPSFSSKGFPKLQKIFDAAQEYISEEILVSAYDVGRKKLKQSFEFATSIFLDSGGYESSKELDLSDTYESDYQSTPWSTADYQSVIDGWVSTRPTVFVTYDAPTDRTTFPKQIARAKALKIPKGVFAKDLLLKPETKASTRVDINKLLQSCKHMDDFSIIGVTEKEIGGTILERMHNISRLRVELDKHSTDRPIHVFGSLDTITTFMYFVSGADIFDGLTWLRYAFINGTRLGH